MYEQKLRPRRMRISPAMRAMVRETSLSVKDFVYPLFVVPGENVREEIPSMPGCYHLSVDEAVKTLSQRSSDNARDLIGHIVICEYPAADRIVHVVMNISDLVGYSYDMSFKC